MRFKVRTRYDEERINRALLELESALSLPAPPLRIECYDISTLHGTHSVGSMVVFSGGRAENSSYRRFRVRMDTPEANDIAMMGEVLRRRFAAAPLGHQAVPLGARRFQVALLHMAVATDLFGDARDLNRFCIGCRGFGSSQYS